MDWLDWLLVIARVVIVFFALLILVMLLIWMERKVIADMEARGLIAGAVENVIAPVLRELGVERGTLGLDETAYAQVQELRSQLPEMELGDADAVMGAMLALETAVLGSFVSLDLLLFFHLNDRDRLAQLKVGQVVTVRGDCGARVSYAAEARNKDKDYSQVHVRNCKLVVEASEGK